MTQSYSETPSTPEASVQVDERLSLADAAQMERWAHKLGVSTDRLRDIIAQVGPRLADVTARLSQPDSVD